ncbi:MAG TPA: acyltransferase [Smithella sp.]|nr:acyltransferase [Smithella sp.]HQG65505.1 acyltransferase [Smithella sp.]HQI73273.1 acyltransferase [Smithella sp.]
MKKIVSNIIFRCARIFSYLYSYYFNKLFISALNVFYTGWISKEFKNFGKDSIIQRNINLRGGQYISIGSKSLIRSGSIIAAWDKYGSDHFQPEIIIGNNVAIGEGSHITAINMIEIGNHVLTGRQITISDNSHGTIDVQSLSTPPSSRALYSKGPVIIEDGVWIGDKVSILSNVRIGKNSIIGANAVVTMDIPENCVAVGMPAKVIKIIK